MPPTGPTCLKTRGTCEGESTEQLYIFAYMKRVISRFSMINVGKYIPQKWISGWWQLKYFFCLHPYLGKIPNLDEYFSIGLKPPTRYFIVGKCKSTIHGSFHADASLHTLRIQICPKKGITPIFLFWGLDGLTINPMLGTGLDS